MAAWRCSRPRAAAIAIRLRGRLHLLIVVLLLLLWRRLRRISLVLVNRRGPNMATRRCSQPRAASTAIRLRGSLLLMVMLLPLPHGFMPRRRVLRSSLAHRVAGLGPGGQPVRCRRSGRRPVRRLLGVGLLLLLLLRAPLLGLQRQSLLHLRLLLLLLLLAPQPLLLLLRRLLRLLVHRLLLLVGHVAAGGRRRARSPLRLTAPLLLRVWLLTRRALPLLLRVLLLLRWRLLHRLLLAVLLSPEGIFRLPAMHTVLLLLLLMLRAPVCALPSHEARGVGLGEAGGLPWRQRWRRRRHEEAGGMATARRAAAGRAAAHGAAGGRGPGGEVADVAGVDALAAREEVG